MKTFLNIFTQIILFINIFIKNIFKSNACIKRLRKIICTIINIFTNTDYKHTLTILGNSTVLCVENFPIGIKTEFIKDFKQIIKVINKFLTYKILNIFKHKILRKRSIIFCLFEKSYVFPKQRTSCTTIWL